MKKTLFATAFAVAALASAPAFAQAVGYAGGSVSYSEAEMFGVEADGESYGVHGAVSLPINDELSGQLSGGLSDSNDSDPSLFGTAHLVSNLEGGRIAGFAGAMEAGDEVLMAIAQGEL